MIDFQAATVESLIAFGVGCSAGYAFALKTALNQAKRHFSEVLDQEREACDEQKAVLSQQNQKLESRVSRLENILLKNLPGWAKDHKDLL